MRAWLTTEALAGDVACRRFTIPVELLAIFMGALDRLTYPSNYEEFDTMTPTEMAAAFTEVLNTYTTSDGECEIMAQLGLIEWRTVPPTPYTGDTVLCDGSDYLKSDYPDYWQMLDDSGAGGTWETDATHFIVPDLMDRFIMGTSGGLGEMGGEATHVLTTGEMPAHTHSVNIPGVVNVAPGVGATPNTLPGLAGTTGSTGGGGAHNNLPPYTKLLPYLRLRAGSVPASPAAVNHAGEIAPYLGTTLPEFSLVCDGATYLKATYPLLWTVLETELVATVKVFEVDATHFKVPDYRGRTLIGYGQGTALTNRIDPTVSIGTETHVLTTAQMPSHRHTMSNSGNTPTSGANNRANDMTGAGGSQLTDLVGGGASHENMQPSRIVRYAIRYA